LEFRRVLFRSGRVRVTRLASGLPVGGDLERASEGDFVRVFEIAADRKAAGESCHAHASSQSVRQVGSGRLAGHVRIGRKHDLLYAVSLDAPEQLVDPQVLRLDAVERRERAPEDVVQAAELARPLDRDEVDRLLDHADHRVIAASVAADRTDFLLGQVPALVAEAHTLLDVLDRRRERKRLVQRSLQDGAEGSPNEDHIAFALDQDKAAERAREGGVQVVGPRDFYWGRAAYLRDPDGRAVELQADS